MTFRIKTFFIILFTSFNFLQAQIPESLSLEECYKTAIEQSPLSSQISLIKQANNYSIKSLNSNYLPQFELNAQATYQSDVTKLPISLPKITIPSLSKDQYKASIDMKQIIFDGNTINRQKKLQYASNNTELQKVDIDIQKLKEQINNFYINILLLDENIKLIQILKEDINNNINKMSSMFENGITLSQNIDILQAELLKIEQKLIELRSNRKQLLTMLSILIKKPLSDSIILKTPMINLSKYDTISQRAELKLFDLQKNTLQNQSELLSTYNMPKIYLFATGGDGKPALNFLSDEFKWYYITGIKLSMP
jgi:outer membrane protein TolC